MLTSDAKFEELSIDSDGGFHKFFLQMIGKFSCHILFVMMLNVVCFVQLISIWCHAILFNKKEESFNLKENKEAMVSHEYKSQKNYEIQSSENKHKIGGKISNDNNPV